MYVDGKENWFLNLGDEKVEGDIWSLEKINLSPAKVPEKSTEFVSEKRALTLSKVMSLF